MRLIDADNLDETITKLNEQGWGITRYEYKLIDRVIFEMSTVDVFGQIMTKIDSYCSDNRDRNDGLYIAMKIIEKYMKQKGGKG